MKLHDVLSWDNVPRFMQLAPEADPTISPVQDDLHCALVQSTLNWSSSAWMSMLRTTLRMD